MNNPVVKLERPPLPSAAATEATALMSILERAALDPAFDPDRLKQILDLYERAAARSARSAYDAAFVEMQPELPEIDKRGRIIIRNRQDHEKIIQSTPYALWDDTNRLIKPILAKHGFGLSFRISQTESTLTTTAVLSHSGGHREETPFTCGCDTTGSKNNVQGWGSAVSYGKRYTGTAILNITTRGEDDDGKSAGAPVTVSEEQAQSLRAALKFKDIAEDRFCRKYKITKVEELPATLFDEANQAIERHTT